MKNNSFMKFCEMCNKAHFKIEQKTGGNTILKLSMLLSVLILLKIIL
jgi:hypothetical protein